jgi:hypothetical protein
MRRMETMTAGGVTLAGLGALVGLAIGSGNGKQTLLTQRPQPAEVRTEIIRKTVNVYRREHPHHAAGTSPGGHGSPGAPAGGPSAVVPAASTIPAVKTRSSGASSSSGGPGASRPVSSRSSGGGDDRSGGRDD